MRPKKNWDELGKARQRALFYAKDPRVPKGWLPAPIGRPKGTPQSMETRRKISAARHGDENFVARRVSAAVDILLQVYGSPHKLAEAILGRSIPPA